MDRMTRRQMLIASLAASLAAAIPAPLPAALPMPHCLPCAKRAKTAAAHGPSVYETSTTMPPTSTTDWAWNGREWIITTR